MRHELLLPDLGFGDRPVRVSLWLVDQGREVTQGDRLLEIVADSVTVDLPSPASGVLVATLVSDDEPLRIGQTLGIIECESSADEMPPTAEEKARQTR
jgi:pyruvate/2-oxoglutarate dehydrogenase complex dihydrolipoamide acyltransferase (E2) component